jgi:hypothetical protein
MRGCSKNSRLQVHALVVAMLKVAMKGSQVMYILAKHQQVSGLYLDSANAQDSQTRAEIATSIILLLRATNRVGESIL